MNQVFKWIAGVANVIKKGAVKHAPGILVGMGTVGVGTGLWYGIKAGPKAVILVEKEERKKAEEECLRIKREGGTVDEDARPLAIELTAREKFDVLWKLYLPPIGMTLFGVLCFWAAHGIDLKRQAIVAGLYSSAEASLQEYQRKVVEMFGQETHEEIKNAIGEDRGKKANIPQETPNGLPGAGATDIWYIIDGKSFPSTYLKVKEVQNDFNHSMIMEMEKTRAELYSMLDPSGQWLRGNREDSNVGWTVDRMLVLRVSQPFGPIATITYEDKYGMEYDPKPLYMIQ